VNACEAMGGLIGPRQLRVTARHVSGEVHVAVSDNGPGVPDFERIFEPFFSSHQQVGLGLSVARSIVVAHGGRLWGVNNAAGGATFYIALPVSNAPTDEIAAAAAFTSRA
jgi:signal transduction histidine kinase